MTETVWIVLICASVLVLFLFRRRLSNFIMRVSRDGVEAEMKMGRPASRPGTAKPRSLGLEVSHTRQWGFRNKIQANLPNAVIRDTMQVGADHEVSANDDSPVKERPGSLD
jgi:hypothetical protein